MKIGINALLMTGARAGIGNYIYNLVKSLGQVDTYNKYRVFLNEDSFGEVMSSNQEAARIKLLGLGSWARILWEQVNLPFILKKSDVDIMHFPDYAMPVVFEGIPSIITVHDLSFRVYPETFSKGKLYTKLLLIKPSLKKARRIIADSHSTRKDLLEYYQVPENKIEVIPIGVNRQFFRPMAEEEVLEYCRLKNNLETGYILYVGTLEPRKNITALIKAFSLLKQDYKLSRKLVIAGGKGWLFEEIFRLVESLNLNQDVIFTGYVPDAELPLLYNGAGVFVYPSLYEGFGLPPLEAMACGTPVVTSSVSSVPEVVGDAGLMVEPLNVEALSEAIYRVLNDPQLAAELSAKGIERAQKFSWAETARKTLAVYEEVYADAGKRR